MRSANDVPAHTVSASVRSIVTPRKSGDTPTAANFNTAIGVTMTAAMEAFILANLGRIQAFATGGG